jgi:AbrB family looped-hinge helix DNA binding protein
MVVRLSSKGQLVIPRKIRKALNLRPGAAFELELTGEQIILKPLAAPQSFEEVIDSLYGLLAGEPLLDMLAEEHRQELARDEKRIARYLGSSGAALC